MSDSLPPPSKIPGTSGGSGLYIAGAVAFAALIGGLLYWKSSSDKPAAPVAAAESAKPVAAPPTPVLDAPPPPPPPEEIDAGAPVPDAKKPTAVASGAPGGAGPCSKCDSGKPSGALRSALTNAAGGARGCYNRALRNGEVSGSMTVSVQVGSTGSVCSASIVNDSVGSSEISSCVLGKFKGRTFPAPESGCVTVNIPISFAIKQ